MLLFVPLLFAPGSMQDPGKPVTQAAERPLEYPTFELFVASRMFKLIASDLDSVDLAELAKQLTAVDDANDAGKEAGERAGGIDTSKGPSARLLPKLPEAEEAHYAMLPIVMMKLSPLWGARAWDAGQLELAKNAATIVARFTGGPALAFAKGDDTKNRAEFEKLVRWFHAIVARPECRAAMIFTMDDGPYAGLPYEAESVLKSSDTKRLGEHLELRLAKVARDEEPWILQCVRDGELLWSRVLSAAPDGVVKGARFSTAEPLDLGPYGWKVYLEADWTYGPENGHLYVDPKGNSPFYFLSW
jgi:hypothetical protein